MIRGLTKLFGGNDGMAREPALRPRLVGTRWPSAVYAIGDVHGCLAQLQLLQRKIIDDARTLEGDKLIVCLGDYVDRGPNSSGVLDFLGTNPPEGFRRICLAGNHEAMMLAFLENPAINSSWLQYGGVETLASYGIVLDTFLAAPPRERSLILESHIPREHILRLRALPAVVTLPGICFVHAGLRPGIPISDQDEDDLLWIRDEFFDAETELDTFVVHGHTPAAQPVITEHRICVDTAAFATGTLTAVRLRRGDQPKLINVTAGEVPV